MDVKQHFNQFQPSVAGFVVTDAVFAVAAVVDVVGGVVAAGLPKLSSL